MQKLLISVVLLFLFVSVIGADAGDDENIAADFIGTWHVTSATNSMILSIQPEGKALFILIQDGSHGIDNVTWKSVAGGILIEGAPRFRFWAGRNRTEARVAMEHLPPEATDSTLQRFPLTFFMRRIDGSRALPERKLPTGWSAATLPPEWDQTAGHRREVTPK